MDGIVSVHTVHIGTKLSVNIIPYPLECDDNRVVCSSEDSYYFDCLDVARICDGHNHCNQDEDEDEAICTTERCFDEDKSVCPKKGKRAKS